VNLLPPALQLFYTQERNGLCSETRLSGVLPFVAVNDPAIIARVPTILRSRHPATIRPLSGSRSGALIQDCPSLGYNSLWVATENDNYQSDYLLFLGSQLPQTLAAIPRGFHVDHLYNRARARQYGLAWIRTTLVPAGVNTSHGAGYEKTITKGEALRERRDMKTMDEITCMKFLGFSSPLKGQSPNQGVEAYVRFAAQAFGLPEAEVRRNILELMEKAASQWAAH